MKAAKASKLKVGARVRWSDGALGTVVELNWHALQIEWDDKTACIFQFKHNEPQWKELEEA